jgi:GT2 family glycosyltransferase
MNDNSATSFGPFIVTFDRPQILRATIRSVLDQTRPPDCLLVVDNGTSPDSRAVVEEFARDGVHYDKPGENLGSAGGCAYGIRALHAEGLQWIHSIDDDQPPKTPDTIERLVAMIGRHEHERIGAVAATGTMWDWSIGELRRIEDDALQGDIEVDTISGSSQLTVSRAAVDDVGTPEPEFFFGFYDPLYSLRLKQAGWRLLIDGDLMREYRELSDRIGHVSPHSWRPVDPPHATWRRYYVTRNYIYRMRKTFDRPDLARRMAAKSLARSVGAWANGPRYGARYTALSVRGIVDGYRGRLGRRVEPMAKYRRS